MSQDPMADAALIASEAIHLHAEVHDRELEQKVRGWIRDEISKIRSREIRKGRHKRRST